MTVPAFFVTATGTDIGKTFVTSGLVRRLRAKGIAATALKPVVSGIDLEDAASLAASDPAQLLTAMGRPVTPAEVARISPHRYAAPLSPDMAAAREGRPLDVDGMIEWCREKAAFAAAPLFVEGVGGAMVPLDDSRTVLDWMVALDLPLLLVTGSYLGTLSHTLTALDVLARRGLRVAAIAVSATPGATVPMAETLTTLARFAPGIPLTAVPRVERLDEADAAFDALLAALGL
ncbi:dethiobiotin synthase [Nitrospirillum viridazoti]|uniref:ATP-dependent dethiobiotin synthetase BioD n=1 Tax=Nitrospirillum viridazoti CBAmc TaxID=1441467 RepID=A0A248JRI7_9PROT|nr:dethiobiotin synthase [Nitrospirillum amazonense]ASG21101.1 dethiobiotin synthase [Nitrospirillum amazonense CBAmc]TWB26150.1 dethiobiotin synthetase [Nitrospirillum amazonense]